MILEEFDSNKVAVINPWNIGNKIDNCPKVAIACYSKLLFESLVAGCKCEEIDYLSNTNGRKPIYEIVYKDKRFILFMMGVGAPAAAADMEDVHQIGCDKFIVFGNCGVLDKTIDDCSIIIPTKAIRDEGTSYHYAPSARMIDVNKKYMDEFIESVKEYGYSYTEEITWTTDAFYRETKEIVDKRIKEGAKVVEMETAALQAVANFREIDFFTFFYAGDNLDGDEWDSRSLSGEVKLDEKSKIAILALELANKISE